MECVLLLGDAQHLRPWNWTGYCVLHFLVLGVFFFFFEVFDFYVNNCKDCFGR